jgi:hypothetical protein
VSSRSQAYAFSVKDHLDDHWVTWFEDATITRHDDGTSTLVVPLADQAELHGVLARLRDVGITLIAITPASNTQE